MGKAVLTWDEAPAPPKRGKATLLWDQPQDTWNQSKPADWSPTKETAFQQWYAPLAAKNNIDPNPDDPRHFYDYRRAYEAGASPGPDGHWPSEFKLQGHPNLIVDGKDTRTGKPALTWDTSVSQLDQSIPPPEMLPPPAVDPSATTVQEMPFQGTPKFKPEQTLEPHRGMAQLTGTPPPPGPDALQPLIQPTLRAGAGAASALGELGATLWNLVMSSGNPALMAQTFMGQGPIHFSGREFIREAERVGVLTEANFLERTAQFTGEGAIDIGALASGAAALQAAGFLPAVANTVSAIGTGMLASLSQAGAERRPFSPKDAAAGAVFMAAAMPVGHALGARLVKAAEDMAGKPLGRAMQSAIQNSAMATVFQAQDFASGDPLWKERWLAAGLAFNITSAHEAMFGGETRPRTAASAKRSVDATAELLAERGVGVTNQAPVEVTKAERAGEATLAEAKVRQAQAQAAAENAQVPFPGTKPKPVTAETLALDFGIPPERAAKIAAQKVTAAERAEIEQAHEDEAVVWESRRRGGEAVALEAAYQRSLLSDEQTAAYETQRQAMPEEVRAELEQAVPTPEEAIAAAQEHATATNGGAPTKSTRSLEERVREARKAVERLGKPKRLGAMVPPAIEADANRQRNKALAKAEANLEEAKAALDRAYATNAPEPTQSVAPEPNAVREALMGPQALRPDEGPTIEGIRRRQAREDADAQARLEAYRASGGKTYAEQAPPKAAPAEPILAVKTKSGLVKSRRGATSYEDLMRTYDIGPEDVASYGTAEHLGTKLKYREEPGAGPTPPEVAHPEGKAAADQVLSAPVVPAVEGPSQGIAQRGSAARRAKARAARPVVEPPPPALTDAENTHLDQLMEAQNAASRFGYKSTLTAKDRAKMIAAGNLERTGKGQWHLTIQGSDALNALTTKYAEFDKARELADLSKPIPVQSILDRAVGKAHEALGAAADVSPQVVTPEVRAKYERALTAAGDKAARARAALKKTGLSDDELKTLGVGALTLGAYVGSKAADDDKTRDAWATAAGLPAIFLMGKGRKLTAGARAEAENAIREAKIDDANRAARASEASKQLGEILKGPISRLITIGKPGKVNADALAEQVIKAAAKIAQEPRNTKTPTLVEAGRFAWKGATEHLRALGGAAAPAMARLIDAAESEARRMQNRAEYDHSKMDTGIAGDNPSHPLPHKEQQALNRFMDWQMDRSLPRPDDAIAIIENGSRKLRRELSAVMLQQKNVLAPEGATEFQAWRDAARTTTDWYGGRYAGWLKRGQEAGMEIQPLYTDNGHYRPRVHRPEAFHPPVSMKLNPLTRAKYFEAYAEAERIQQAIAKATGMTAVDVRRALEMERELGPSMWRKTPIESLSQPIPPELHRFFQSPIGTEWSPSVQYNHYVPGLATRIQHVRHFGYKGAFAKALLELGAKEGTDRKQMAELFDVGTGNNDGSMGLGYRMLNGLASQLKAPLYFGALGRMVVGQFSQMIAPMMSVGANPLESHRMTFEKMPGAVRGAIESSSMPKRIRDKFGRDLEYRVASNAGVLTRALHLQELARNKSPFAIATSLLVKGTGGSLMDRASRISGATIGDAWFRLTYGRLLDAVRSADPRARDEAGQFMDEIFRSEPLYAEAAKRTDLQPDQYEFLASKAAQIISDRWNHNIAPSTMPLMYSHEAGNVLFALGTFGYKQTKTFNQVMREFAKTPASRRRIAAATVTLTGAGMASQLWRNLGADFDEDGPWWKLVLDGAAYTWFGPVYVNAAQNWLGKYGNPVKASMGPLIGKGLDFGEAVYRSEKSKSLAPLEAFGARTLVPKHPVPFVPQPRDLLLEELGLGGKKKQKRQMSSLQ